MTDPQAHDASFSFRWGIPLLDGGYTTVPNFFFDHYAEAGVTRIEFLTILHLARYRYEKPGSECRPSVKTVARQMGYSMRTIQRILAGMEKHGLLVRHYRHGYATIYDFSGFSRAVLAVAVDNSPARDDVGVTPDTCVTSTPDTCVTSPMTHASPEEERKEKQTRSDGGGLTTEQCQIITSLADFGVSEPVARELALLHDLSFVRDWLDYAESARGLYDPPAFVVKRLLDVKPVPPKSRNSHVKNWHNNPEARKRRYATEGVQA